MKQLILLRHAEAENMNQQGDKARMLSPVGIDDAMKVGAYFKSQNIVPNTIYTSPAVRARQTASLIHKHLLCPAPIQINDLYLINAADLIHWITTCKASECIVIVVAHNPGLSECASMLTSKDVVLRAAGFVGIEIHDQWEDILKTTHEIFIYGSANDLKT